MTRHDCHHCQILLAVPSQLTWKVLEISESHDHCISGMGVKYVADAITHGNCKMDLLLPHNGEWQINPVCMLCAHRGRGHAFTW